MNDHAIRYGRRSRLTVLAVALFVMSGITHGLPAQEGTDKKPLTVDDYSLWRNIGDEAISSDGKWVTYVLRFTNVPDEDAKPVLHLLDLETNEDVEVPNASGGTFSDDSGWIAYQVDPGGRRGGRGRRGGQGDTVEPGQEPQGRRGGSETPEEPMRAELRNLSTGALRSWQNVQSFTFSNDSTHLLLRRRLTAPSAGGRGGQGGGGNRGGGDRGPRGVDVIVHDLGSGRDQLIGRVGDISFNDAGDLLAYTVDTEPKDGNGLFVLDLTDDRIHPLDNDARSYNRLQWNEDGTALAVLKGDDVEKMRERANLLIAFPDLRAALDGTATPVILDPTGAEGFPPDFVVSDRAALSWSSDNARVYFGMKEQMAELPEPETDRDEAADVDVWNTLDERIQSQQIRQRTADLNRTYQEAFDVGAGVFVHLADETMRDLDVADGHWAIGRDLRGHIKDYGPSTADVYRVDTATGARTLILDDQMVGGNAFGLSPDSRYLLYWQDDKYQAYDLDAGISRTLGGTQQDQFVDLEDDHPGPRSAYGIAGYTEDGTGIIASARYDLWLVPLDGSDAESLTGGRGEEREVRFRYVDVSPDNQGGGRRGRRGGGGRRKIDLRKPITLSAYGEWTKKSGFYELADGGLREIVYDDATFSTPRKADDADRFLFTRQTFEEFPDLRVSGPDFGDSTRITDANPQQAEYLWGHRMLFDFENAHGDHLQGILALPDNYQDGEKRPMLVNFYELNSRNLHRYTAPSYLSSMGSSPIQAVSEGYITMLPDIRFHIGPSHSDMLEAVEAAVRKVIEMGYVDPARIGINGHSYGGEGAAFIGTRSRLFAAVGMGAGVTDLYQDFNQNWGWAYGIDGGSGLNGAQYYLYSQGREGVSPWDDPEMYMFESAITHAPEVTAPFLIMHGTADPTVAFFHGLGMYNALRFFNKPAVLLAYRGEGHGLRGLANRRDLTIRYFQFFDHYLMDKPAPKWLTEGVSLIEKEMGEGPEDAATAVDASGNGDRGSGRRSR